MLGSLYRLYDRHLKPGKVNDPLYRPKAALHRILSRLGGASLKRSMTLHPARVDGHLIHTDPQDSLGLHSAKVFDPAEMAVLRAHVPAGGVAVDAGANIGVYTLALARLVGATGKVHAFEPEPANYALLERNIAANAYANVSAYPMALADLSGTLKLSLNPDNAGMHRLGETGISVKTARLDDLVTGRVDFIKIDVEGAEAAVLRGMTRILTENPQIKLLVEYNPAGDADALFQALSGFSWYSTGNSRMTARAELAALGSRGYANLFFQRGSL